MKPSMFNKLVAYKGGHLIYNFLWRSLLFLDEADTEVFEQGRYADLSCKTTLEAYHFLVDDVLNEKKLIDYIYDKYRFQTKALLLTITPTMACNCCCEYCYEDKRPGIMGPEVVADLKRFVERQYEYEPFSFLRVCWYGGEPLLGFPVIEELSEHFISFCAGHGVEYTAHLLSNISLATPETIERMVELKIASAMPTIDGDKEHHDRRRQSVSGRSLYEDIKRNACGMAHAGISVRCNVNIDKNNLEGYRALKDELEGVEGLTVRTRNIIGDYHPLDDEEFDLLSQEEYADIAYQDFMGKKPGRKEFEELLRPITNPCASRIERNFVVDEAGDIYKCLGHTGKTEEALGNVRDGRICLEHNPARLAFFVEDEFMEHEPCASCAFVPVCLGSCLDNYPNRFCVPYKFRFDDMLAGYADSLDALDVAPSSLESIFDEFPLPAVCDGGTMGRPAADQCCFKKEY